MVGYNDATRLPKLTTVRLAGRLSCTNLVTLC